MFSSLAGGSAIVSRFISRGNRTDLIPAFQRATQGSNLRPTAPEALAVEHKANHCTTLREHEGRRPQGLIHDDSQCSAMIRHETSRECVQNAATERSARAEPHLAVEER
jgi:hypothetical protein